MAAQHTPGPWQWNQHEDDRDAGPDNPGYLFAPNAPYSVAPGHLGVSVLHAIYPQHGERYVRVTCEPVDAALIAAAPELYDHAETALEILIDTLGPCDPGCDCIIHPLTDALAKARGEAVAS